MISNSYVGHPTLQGRTGWKFDILYEGGQIGQRAKCVSVLCGGRGDVSIFWTADLGRRDARSTGTRRESNGRRARSRMMIPAMTLSDMRQVLALPCRDWRSSGTTRCRAVKLFVMLAEARKCWKLAGPNKLLIDQRESARAYLAAACTSLSSSKGKATRKG